MPAYALDFLANSVEDSSSLGVIREVVQEVRIIEESLGIVEVRKCSNLVLLSKPGEFCVTKILFLIPPTGNDEDVCSGDLGEVREVQQPNDVYIYGTAEGCGVGYSVVQEGLTVGNIHRPVVPWCYSSSP